MHSETKHDRDPFTFSLRGARVVSSHAFAPVIAGRGINRAWDARLGRRASRATRGGRSPTTHRVEALLARYFAHGCCTAT